MQLHQYQFEKVTDYLHHRDPYLMVDRIVSIGDRSVETAKLVSGNEFFIPGHFPGAPIFPGAMMQELTTQSAGVLIAAKFNPNSEYDTHDPHFNEYALGVLVKVNSARYKSFARPGDELLVSVTLNDVVSGVFDFSASIKVAGKTIMRNAFQLTNIKSSLLTAAS
jgi:3-hydroxyacyl-[acyl-carrier-protein] dehydratase